MAQSYLRNRPMERRNERRARIGMAEYQPPESDKTVGQAGADFLGGLSLATAPIPLAGDISGLAADAAMYAAYPEERTLGNYAMTALGVLPIVPSASALRVGRKAAQQTASQLNNNLELYSPIVNAAGRALAGERAAELIKSQPQIKASEALGQLMDKGFKQVITTQADRTRVGGGNIGGPAFPVLGAANPEYAGKAWGVMDRGTASRLTNLTSPETLWTTMLGSATQLKTNPVVFNRLKRAFLSSMKKGNLPEELANKYNQNLALTFGEGVDIRDPNIWKQADSFAKRSAIADVLLGQGISPKDGGVALGGKKGTIFDGQKILREETEQQLLHPSSGGNAPTFSLGPRLFTLGSDTEYRPDLHPGFPTLISGRDLGMNVMPTPTEIFLPDWHRNFRAKNSNRKPGYYDLAFGLEGEGLPAQKLTPDYIRHLMQSGYALGGTAVGLSALRQMGSEKEQSPQ